MYHVPSVLSLREKTASTFFCGIEFIWAKIGHGKTHHVVRSRLLPALKEGRYVFTNIDFGGPLKVGDVEVFSEELRAGMIFSDYLQKDIRHLFHVVNGTWVREHLFLGPNQVDFSNIPSGSRVILDEVQNIFSIDGYKDEWKKGFFRFLCVCRHYDVDFVFISQNTDLVDRRLVKTSSDFIKIKNMGFLSSILKSGYRVTHHQSQFDWEGYRSESFKFDPDIFTLYQSSKSIVKHQHQAIPKFLLILVLAIFVWGGVFAFKAHKSLLWGRNRSHTVAPASFVPSSTFSTPPTPASLGVSSSLSSAQVAVQTLLTQYNYRDSVISSTDLPHNTWVAPRPYHPRLRDGVETFSN